MAKRYAVCKLCSHAHSSREPHVLIGGPEPSREVRKLAAVASTVEQGFRKAQVGGSNPPRGSTSLTVEIPQTVDDVRRIVAEINSGVERMYDDMDALGKRLNAIHDTGLWREMGYRTWESFIASEVKLSRRHANRQVSHQRFLALLPGPSAPASAREPVTSGVDTNGTNGPTPTEGQTRTVRNDPEKVAQVQRMVAQGVAPVEAIKRATKRTRDPATGAACAHEPVTVVVCKNCGRRLE